MIAQEQTLTKEQHLANVATWKAYAKTKAASASDHGLQRMVDERTLPGQS